MAEATAGARGAESPRFADVPHAKSVVTMDEAAGAALVQRLHEASSMLGNQLRTAREQLAEIEALRADYARGHRAADAPPRDLTARVSGIVHHLASDARASFDRRGSRRLVGCNAAPAPGTHEALA
jgi:hypothetical protein